MNNSPKLILLSDQIQSKKMYELSADVYTIGRTEDQNVCLPDSTVSSKHCELIKSEDGNYIVQDLGSSNGTRINGVKIVEQQLAHSDILQVGGIEIMYHCEDADVNSAQNSPQTGINLANTENGVPINDMGNVNPFKNSAKKGDSKKANLVITISFAILVLIVVILAIMLMIKFYK